MRRRVVIPGMGVVTPGGNSVDAMWESLCEGRSGVGSITHFDATNFPTRFAAEVKNFQLGNICEKPERFEHSGRNILFAVGAAMQAMKGSGLLENGLDPARLGGYLGAGAGQQGVL